MFVGIIAVLSVASCSSAVTTASVHATSATSNTVAAVTPSTTAAIRPTATTTKKPTAASIPAQTSRLVTLTVAPESHAATYSRIADFGDFTDQSGCEDTRAVLLIRESRAPVTFTTPSDCTVKAGSWTDPWSGVTTTVAHDFDIDHTVPLENAWVSGAWAWTQAQRVAYTNDLTETDHLVSILASENESKGDDGPDRWKPPLQSSWCRYALDWDHIKASWHLSATPSEWAALTQMVATC